MGRESTPGASSDTMMEMNSEARAHRPGGADSEKEAAGAPAADATSTALVGQPAPEFSLERLDGRPLPLSSLKGKLVVLIFGSYSSPSFRQRAIQLPELTRQVSTHATFLVIYTKEAHPTGGWEVDRNKDEHISVPAAKDLAARKLAAKQARTALKLNSIPILLDDMSDSTAAAYGARENTALLIGRDGTILARQEWFDPFRMKRAIDDATAVKPADRVRAQ